MSTWSSESAASAERQPTEAGVTARLAFAGGPADHSAPLIGQIALEMLPNSHY